MHVNNVPAYAYDHRYIVARECDGEFWFWGAWDDLQTAQGVATEISGTVIETRLLTD